MYFIFISMSEKAANDENALFYYEGVKKTRGSLIHFFPGKC